MVYGKNEPDESGMNNQAREDTMIKKMINRALRDAMIESMSDQDHEFSMNESKVGQTVERLSQRPDLQTDSWIAVYDDFSCESSKEKQCLKMENLRCYIHKKFERASNSGKTAYFSYQIIGKNSKPSQLEIGNYSSEGAEEEYWTTWEYAYREIAKKHWFTSFHRKNNEYDSRRSFIYPIGYSFADVIPLGNYNPFNFSFEKMNFLNKGVVLSCGDKLSRVKIINTNGNILVLSVFNFENNIIPLLKDLNNSNGFADFVINTHLKQSVDYLEAIEMELSHSDNKFASRGARNIIDKMNDLTGSLSRFIPQFVKNNPDSDYCKLIYKYDSLSESLKDCK